MSVFYPTKGVKGKDRGTRIFTLSFASESDKKSLYQKMDEHFNNHWHANYQFYNIAIYMDGDLVNSILQETNIPGQMKKKKKLKDNV